MCSSEMNQLFVKVSEREAVLRLRTFDRHRRF